LLVEPRRTTTDLFSESSSFGATSLVMRSVVLEKLRAGPQPEIFIRPPALAGVSVLDFSRAAKIIKACEPVKDELKQKLEPLLAAFA